MATTIYCCMVNDLPNDYSHVMRFNTVESQVNYFMNRAFFTCSQNIPADGFCTQLTVPQTIETCRRCDYLFYQGNDTKYYFYFINQIEYLTQNTTRLHLELDVFSTYQHDIEFLPSFIERQHVSRWVDGKPNINDCVDEGLPTYEYTICEEDFKLLKDGYNGCYLFVSSSPLGMITDGSGGGGGGIDSGCGDPNLGSPSTNGFLFIKGFEGLAQYAHNIGDGVLTIGYGCTDKYDGSNYQQLKANEPVSDELASTVFANSLVENYGIPLINRLEQDGVQVNNHEFDALLSFVYNAGLGSLTASQFYQSIQAGNKETAYQQWLTTNILAGSQFETGLRERRLAEANIFKSGQYDIRNTLIYGQGGSIAGTLDVMTSFIPDLIRNTCQGATFVNELTEDELGNIWQFPVSGRVSATFPTYPDGTTHSGLDIAGNEGLKIRSSGDGVVYYVGSDASSGYGYHVVVQMTNGTRHWYGHMKTLPYVREGETVNPQTVLGIVGSTGNSSGPHVHWEIRTAPYAYDFTCWINPSPRTKLYDQIQGVGD